MVFKIRTETSPDPLVREPYQGIGPFLGSSPARTSAPTEKARHSRSTAAGRRSTTPTRQQRTMIFSTPTKGPSGSLSPWKVRAAVNKQARLDMSARTTIASRTTTTKVPLKGEDEHSPVKRRKRSRRNSADVGSTSTTAPIERPLHVDDIEPAPSVEIDDDALKDQSASKLHPPRGTRRNSVAVSQSGLATPSATAATSPEKRNLRSSSRRLEYTYTPFESERTPEMSASKRIRERTPTPRKPPGLDESTLTPLPGSTPPQPTRPERIEKYDMNSGELAEGDDTEMCDEDEEFPMTIDDTAVLDRSVAESEGFSMVSIDALKSHREQAERELASTIEQSESQEGTEATYEPILLGEDGMYIQAQGTGNDGAVKYPSHPAIQDRPWSNPQQVRPRSRQSPSVEITTGSFTPKFVSKKRKLDEVDSSSSKETFSRRKLSDELDIGDLLTRSAPGYVAQPEEPLDQRISPRLPASSSRSQNFGPSQARLPTPADTAEDSSISPVQNSRTGGHPQPRLTQSVASFERAEPVTHPGAKIGLQPRPSSASDSISRTVITQQIIAQQLEEEYQEERRNVINQAERATNAQVVMLDSDDEDAAQPAPPTQPTLTSGADIWLEEANSSMQDSMLSQAPRVRPQPLKPAKKAKEPTLDLRELLGEDDNHPTRGKIPRTWRRTSGHHFLYTDEAPSPERTPAARPLFEQDLEAYMSDSDESEGQVRTPERSVSPLKGILSSPLRKSEQRSPKEVRFGLDRVRTFEDYMEADEECSSGSELAYALFHAAERREQEHKEGESSITDASDVRQLHREIVGSTAVKAAAQDAPNLAPKARSVLNPDPDKRYAPLFGSWTPTPKPPQSKTKEPPVSHHPSQQRETTSVSPTRTESSPVSSKQTVGIFGRLGSWLFPPKQAFNRNHYLLLDHHWKASFPTAELVLDAALEVHKLSDEHFWDEVGEETDELPPELARLVGTVVDSRDGIYSTPGMRVTPLHCAVVHRFMAEARERGIPLLSDGNLSGPRAEGYPRRNANGRVMRVKEEWAAWDVMARVYGLWARDVLSSLEDRGEQWPA